MAEPTENSLLTTWVPTYGLNIGPATGLIYGRKWYDMWNDQVEITWSVPQTIGYFQPRYSSYNEPKSWYAFTSSEIVGAAMAMKSWASVSGLTAVRTSDNAFTVGEIRFAKTSRVDQYSDAHAYLPDDHPSAGDIWMNATAWNLSGIDAKKPGTYAYLTLLHEIGHALGLKHPFEKSEDNKKLVPASYDSLFHTVMSYSAKPWSPWITADFYPTTPMYLDIVAMHHLYGRDTKTNSGNTVYKFGSGQQYWQTIYDAGGKDAVVYYGSQESRIDLRPGKFSTLSEPIHFSNGMSSRSTVSVGPGVVIETAIGGNGSDTLIGNTANNTLKGRVGNDTLMGGSGNDYLLGGSGNDRLYGNAGKDVFIFDTALSAPDAVNVDRIADFNAADDTIRLDDLYFSGLKRGILSAANFCIGAQAKDARDRIIYDRTTGDLSYDPDGTGPAAQIKFASLPARLKLTAKDFDVF